MCHYPDLGSDTSSVWNFCVRFSDVIWRGNQWQRRQMSAVFSDCGGNKKRATCFATMLQNELNSDVARCTTHVQTC